MKTRLLGIAGQIMALAIIISVVLLILGIGVLILIRACTLGTFSRGNSDRGGGGGGGDTRERDIHNGLSSDDLEKLPCYEYSLKDREENYCSSVECALCLETFRDSDKCRLLPLCKHSFHAECVDYWLLKSSVCPLCRTICVQQLVVGKGAE